MVHLDRRLATRLVRPFAGLVASATLTSMLFVGTSGVGLAVDTVSCGVHPLDVELIVDTSGSMTSLSGSPAHSRLYWLQQAATQLVGDLNSNGGVGGGSGIHHVGLTSFSGTTATVRLALGASTASAVDTAINGLSASGNTPLKVGMATGAADLSANQRAMANGIPVVHALVLLSDGRPNPDPGQRPSAGDISSYLGSADVAYSIALGQGGTGSSQVDLTLMQSLANPSGNYKHVVDASDLSGIFSNIFSELTCPQIGIDKTPSVSTLPFGGGSVTYTYAVTNTNPDAALSDVAVTDDKCSPVDYQSGDVNHDDMLQSSETWMFSCTTTLSDTTTNVATASGEYNGVSFTAKDTATVEVEDATPTPTPTEQPTPTPTPTEQPTPTPTPTEQPTPTPEESVEAATPTPTPEGSVEAATPTPAASVPNTASEPSQPSGGAPLALFVLLTMGSLTALATVNVATARRRR
jgi:von Willebrand factor type A domain